MSCCSGSCCTVCKVIGGIVALLLTLTSVAALLGLWHTHMVDGTLVFGSGDASLSILAFVLSIVMWKKTVSKMCPCNKGCNCGSPNCPVCTPKKT